MSKYGKMWPLFFPLKMWLFLPSLSKKNKLLYNFSPRLNAFHFHTIWRFFHLPSFFWWETFLKHCNKFNEFWKKKSSKFDFFFLANFGEICFWMIGICVCYNPNLKERKRNWAILNPMDGVQAILLLPYCKSLSKEIKGTIVGAGSPWPIFNKFIFRKLFFFFFTNKFFDLFGTKFAKFWRIFLA